jgi:hypothetical protein
LSRCFLAGQGGVFDFQAQWKKFVTGRQTPVNSRGNNVDSVNELMYKKYVSWAPL